MNDVTRETPPQPLTQKELRRLFFEAMEDVILEFSSIDPQTATPERLEKAGDEVEDFITDTSRRTKRMMDKSVLDLLLSRSELTGAQYHAGMRYQHDFETAYKGIAALDTTKEAVDGAQHLGHTDNQLDAMSRWHKATRAVTVTHAHALKAILIYEVPMVEYGRRCFNYRDEKDARLAAKVALVRALDQLDIHYHGKRRGIYRKSHREDYRPGIDNSAPRDVDDSGIAQVPPATTRLCAAG